MLHWYGALRLAGHKLLTNWNAEPGVAIAQWIHLRLCCPGFESQEHHLLFFQLLLFKLYI